MYLYLFKYLNSNFRVRVSILSKKKRLLFYFSKTVKQTTYRKLQMLYSTLYFQL